MKYLFWAAFVLLLDVSISQEVEVPCKELKDCKFLHDAPSEVICHEGFCKCKSKSEEGEPQNCALVNITSVQKTEEHLGTLDLGGLVGRICSLDKDCSVYDTNASCNTTRKQCACNKGYVASVDNQRCLPALQYNDSGCETDKQCLYSTGNTTCSDKVCLCNVNYHYTSGTCWATKEFGSNCSVTGECAHIQDAVCDGQYRCNCPSNRVINPNVTACLSVASKIEDECIESIQCTELLGEGGTCVDNHCRCHENHHHHSTNTTYKCIPNLEIGAACETHGECSNGEGGGMQCVDKKCACGTEGFAILEGKCQPVSREESESSSPSSANQFGDVSTLAISLVYFILFSSVFYK